MISKRKGFTLIEMLIVIAIIGILASIVLVGLGPVQRRGRDARRQSDLRGVQTALELYYHKCGHYPGGATCQPASNEDWAAMVPSVTGATIGISKLPNDPSSGQTYFYGTDGPRYIVGAKFEDGNNPALNDDIDGTVFGVDCDDPVYCIDIN
jgi:prepilin-type N-terminal cleavage/methylation domain-containing protein